MRYKVAVIMGSDSDFKVMEQALSVFENHDIDYDVRITSAHRTPEEMFHFAKEAKGNGYRLIIAGAGGAAHLPGMVASITSLPVIGVPVRTRAMDGMDSALSILQMPGGVPVATVGINNAKGAAELAVKMLFCYDKVEEMASPSIKIIYNESDIDSEGLDKVVETLHFYGLQHEVGESTKNAMAVLNLADTRLEELSELIEDASSLPVITVPVKGNVLHDFSRALQVVENVCQISNNSLPLAMLAVNGYQNAGIMMAKIAGIHNQEIYERVANQQERLRQQVIEKDTRFLNRNYTCM